MSWKTTLTSHCELLSHGPCGDRIESLIFSTTTTTIKWCCESIHNCGDVMRCHTKYLFTTFHLNMFQPHRPSLSPDEVTTVRQTLQSQGLEVDTEFVSIDILCSGPLGYCIVWCFGLKIEFSFSIINHLRTSSIQLKLLFAPCRLCFLWTLPFLW